MLVEGYDAYLQHAFPEDMLKPITCSGKSNLGAIATTLVDTLSTLIMVGDAVRSREATDFICNRLSFDKDYFVSMFEANIRVVGGLLSAHALLARHPSFINLNTTLSANGDWTESDAVTLTDLWPRRSADGAGNGGAKSDGDWPDSDSDDDDDDDDGGDQAGPSGPLGPGSPPWDASTPYSGCLLWRAVELVERMMPAFDTPTGIPKTHVRLSGPVREDAAYRSAAYHEEKTWHNETEVCTACAGTLIMEFGALSRMTGNPRYEEAALRALVALYQRRTKLGLVGGMVGVKSGRWAAGASTIGAGTDSYLEYLLKGYLLLGYDEMLEAFADSYASVMYFMHDAQVHVSNPLMRPWVSDVDPTSGHHSPSFLSSLAAFWPGLQALVGQTQDAAKLHREFRGVWAKNNAIPEQFHPDGRPHPMMKAYPLRPEHIESGFVLMSALGGPDWQAHAASIRMTLEPRTRSTCGFAQIQDVTKHGNSALEDSMESFFLSEVAKYLYVTQASSGELLNHIVLTTEGHILPPALDLPLGGIPLRPDGHGAPGCGDDDVDGAEPGRTANGRAPEPPGGVPPPPLASTPRWQVCRAEAAGQPPRHNGALGPVWRPTMIPRLLQRMRDATVATGGMTRSSLFAFPDDDSDWRAPSASRRFARALPGVRSRDSEAGGGSKSSMPWHRCRRICGDLPAIRTGGGDSEVPPMIMPDLNAFRAPAAEEFAATPADSGSTWLSYLPGLSVGEGDREVMMQRRCRACVAVESAVARMRGGGEGARRTLVQMEANKTLEVFQDARHDSEVLGIFFASAVLDAPPGMPPAGPQTSLGVGALWVPPSDVAKPRSASKARFAGGGMHHAKRTAHALLEGQPPHIMALTLRANRAETFYDTVEVTMVSVDAAARALARATGQQVDRARSGEGECYVGRFDARAAAYGPSLQGFRQGGRAFAYELAMKGVMERGKDAGQGRPERGIAQAMRWLKEAFGANGADDVARRRRRAASAPCGQCPFVGAGAVHPPSPPLSLHADACQDDEDEGVYPALQGPLILCPERDRCGGPCIEDAPQGSVLVLERGGCPFLRKSYAAAHAGAAALLVVNVDPPGDVFTMMGAGNLRDEAFLVPTLMVSAETGQRLRDAADEAHLHGSVASEAGGSGGMQGGPLLWVRLLPGMGKRSQDGPAYEELHARGCGGAAPDRAPRRMGAAYVHAEVQSAVRPDTVGWLIRNIGAAAIPSIQRWVTEASALLIDHAAPLLMSSKPLGRFGTPGALFPESMVLWDSEVGGLDLTAFDADIEWDDGEEELGELEVEHTLMPWRWHGTVLEEARSDGNWYCLRQPNPYGFF
ncbi:unnamed protein product [Pedinophyceae sp. YPF-701]|nr:unnamed protein product [Pedinophyceae sp. YPF-701]